MRFLFTTLQTYESEFYGRVGEELRAHGHDVSHVTVSRAAARQLPRARASTRAACADVAAAVGEPADARRRGPAHRGDLRHTPHPRRLPGRLAVQGRDEAWCVARTVQHFRALERIFDDVRPDVVVPEVGNETIRVATHLIGLAARDPRAVPPLHDLPRPAAAVRGHAARADRPARRGARADRRRARGAGGVPRLLHRRGEADPRAPPRADRGCAGRRSSPATSGASASEDRDNDYLRAVAAAAHERVGLDARARGTAVLRPPRRGPPVRLLPAPRHRRLQDHAGDPALRRPGLARRAGRRRAARRARPGAEGAPDVDRPELLRAAPAAAAPAERPPRRAARQLARADPQAPREWR